MIEQDFPLSPNYAADSTAYYNAFLKAEEALSKVPKKSQGANYERELSQLTKHFYSAASSGEPFFRAKLGAPELLTAVWLSKVKTLAEWFAAAKEVPNFTGIQPAFMEGLSKLSKDTDDLLKIDSLLLERGIILIYEPAIPGMKVDGAAFKLVSGIPVIGMSLRFPRVDYYWFTLMHELAHIALHFELLSNPIVDDLEDQSGKETELIELQANRLASDSLIPRAAWRSCPAKYSLEQRDVFDFAAKVGIAPEIVAGRLRRETGRYDLFGKIVNSINIREILLGKI